MGNRDTSFDLARRRFGQMAVAGALGGHSLRAAPEVPFGRPPMKWGIKHSMQLSSLREEDLQLAKQLGMEWVNLWSSPDKYKEIVARVGAAGLKVAKIGNGSVHNQAAITLNLPGRDAKIEEFKQNLRSLAAAGIR